jgi:H+-transporting ATPase
MIDQLRALGVHTVMVTGDAATTAAFVLRTMTLVTLAFNGQAVFYVVRERKRLWSSRPSAIVMLSSGLDLLIIDALALRGILMAPLAPSLVAAIFVAAVVLACIMDQAKVWLFAHFKMT